MLAAHPAPFNRTILSAVADLIGPLPKGSFVLDLFAGIGERLGQLGRERGWHVVANEIQRGWVKQAVPNGCALGILGDATRLALADSSIDAAATSISYGNRVNDIHVSLTAGTPAEKPGDRSRRTYEVYLKRAGEGIHPRNTGAGMHFGRRDRRYELMHNLAFAEVHRVLRPGASFIINTKDFYETRRKKKVLRQLTAWVGEALRGVGFSGPVASIQVPCAGDQNTSRDRSKGLAVVEYEDVGLYIK